MTKHKKILKFHWGWGIAVFYLLFVVLLLGFLVFTTFHKVDLVRDDYYEHDTKFQKHIDNIERTAALEDSLKIVVTPASVVLKFPNIEEWEAISGFIEFYKPDDKAKDIVLNISLEDENLMFISTKDFAKGQWYIKIYWKIEQEEYYNEKKFFIK